ncbi:MAG TPA: DoxX family protein [Chitinophagaceae bacterium]|nr:DoxX family protein [Chitinophagaceae bacterium]
MTKRNKIIYWIATIWLSLGMVSTGVVQLLKLKGNGPGSLESMTHLGYPVYFVTLLGVSKILGVIALLIPKFPLLKEWAYAGFFFMMSGAIFTHIAAGNSISEIFPSLLLLILTVVSWYFRPIDRKLILANH